MRTEGTVSWYYFSYDSQTCLCTGNYVDILEEWENVERQRGLQHRKRGYYFKLKTTMSMDGLCGAWFVKFEIHNWTKSRGMEKDH